ncbi:hypothetical protein E3N88_17710 [Mikania micrantha]|uniref:Methyltransferase FkbM domain-containing protein n=1 Tax=Mikania micrantha TaxID=192012 RepID=A0A5N6NT59_9ASTR|nr:hypothetical protein E3N88_17710 [Mikania micrantha]
METNIKTLRKKTWFLPLIISLLTSSILIAFSLFFTSSSNPFHQIPSKSKTQQIPVFVESKLNISPTKPATTIPKLAYLISGSSGDVESLKRTLKALYHPLNQYVVHLDLESPAEERLELVDFVNNEPVFREVGNVRLVGRSNLVTYRGPTMVTNTLHAAAILLKDGGDWDWFINLSASDYPLVTQDDLLHTFSTVPRDLNFIEHTSDIGWKEYQRAKPLIVDPGLYSLKKSDVFWVSQKRSVPTAYKLFTGSAWMMLSRPFVEYCLWGWDNLPRIVLMYYANFLSSPEGYFHTVICNAEEFKNTTVNHDLHFISWDNPPKQHPHFLSIDDYERMVESHAPFARKFGADKELLDKIDLELLGREADGFVTSNWFDRSDTNKTIAESIVRNATELKPGPGAERIKTLIGVQEQGIKVVAVLLDDELLEKMKSEGKMGMFIDVGANVGMATFAAAVMGFRVFAFEPIFENLQSICNGIYFNRVGDLVHVFEAATSDHAGNITFHKLVGRLDNSAVSATGAKMAFKSNEEIELQVRSVPLDQVIPEHESVLLLKIDVQGWEYHVLKGAKNLLSRKKGEAPYLIYEEDERLLQASNSSAKEIREFLDSVGYTRCVQKGTDAHCTK